MDMMKDICFESIDDTSITALTIENLCGKSKLAAVQPRIPGAPKNATIVVRNTKMIEILIFAELITMMQKS